MTFLRRNSSTIAMDAPPGAGRYSGRDDWCQVDATFEAINPWIKPSSPEAWRVSGFFVVMGSVNQNHMLNFKNTNQDSKPRMPAFPPFHGILVY